MVDFLGADDNFAFVIALALMLLIAALEVVSLLVGLGLSQAVDSLIPDAASADVSGMGSNAASAIFSFFALGQIPALILLTVSLATFGLTGLAMQTVAAGLAGTTIPGLLAALISIPPAALGVRLFAKAYLALIPDDESEAMSAEEFVGSVAVVLRGRARRGEPAEAKLHDRFGQAHYLLVEPDLDGEEFAGDDEVLLVRKAGSRFFAIRNVHSALSPRRRE